MYLLFILLFLILIFFLNHWRKKKIIRKIHTMCIREKHELLNELLQPFGYSYVLSRDIFTASTNACQQDMGYCSLFDTAAHRSHMVFDALPVYFDYAQKTWLIEFWKGQYGICIGGEIGVYYADRLLNGQELKHTLFQSAEEELIPKLSFSFYEKNGESVQLCTERCWLPVFKMGYFCMPADLSMHISLTFPSYEMAEAFAKGLVASDYSCDDVCICCQTVTFTFDGPVFVHSLFRRLQNRLVQYRNRFWCQIYCFLTQPFHLSLDRILYLHYYLPFTLHRLLQIRKYGNHKTNKRTAPGRTDTQ